ncbi:MAG TPA: hypothetical protein VN742_04585, partial [Candidatus Binataceae bacterium]|nr:hypothetical protein [Candidatus Binataceae bacterium]
LPPPQLRSSAAARKATTGTSTKDLRNQTIEPCTMPTPRRGVKHHASLALHRAPVDSVGFSGWKKSGGRLIKRGKLDQRPPGGCPSGTNSLSDCQGGVAAVRTAGEATVLTSFDGGDREFIQPIMFSHDHGSARF